MNNRRYIYNNVWACCRRRFGILVIACFAAGVMALLLPSCKEKKEKVSLLDVVPVSAVSVRSLNVEQMLREAGTPTPVKNGRLLPMADKLFELISENDQVKRAVVALAQVKEGVDLTRMLSFTTAAGSDLALFHMLSPDAVHESLPVLLKKEWEESDDFEYIELSKDCVVALENDNVWIAPDLIAIETSLREAHETPITHIKGVDDFISEEHVGALTVNCDNSMIAFLGGKTKWLCVAFDIAKRSVSAEVKLIDADGSLEKLGENFTDINTDFLQYTPPNSAVVLAFGKFNGNQAGLSLLLGQFAPIYLEQTDGTTSLYALPASSNPQALGNHTPGSWNVQTMVHVPKQLVSEAIRQYGEAAGNEVTDLGNQWTYSRNNATYYYGDFNGNIVFSANREILHGYDNDYLPEFEGRKLAMIIDVPPHTPLATAWNLPEGIDFRVSLRETTLTARLSFPGSPSAAFPGFLSLPLLPDLHAHFKSVVGL